MGPGSLKLGLMVALIETVSQPNGWMEKRKRLVDEFNFLERRPRLIQFNFGFGFCFSSVVIKGSASLIILIMSLLLYNIKHIIAKRLSDQILSFRELAASPLD